jgi:hypothetical protein
MLFDANCDALQVIKDAGGDVNVSSEDFETEIDLRIDRLGRNRTIENIIDKADLLASWDNGRNHPAWYADDDGSWNNDWCVERLYRTPDGGYFILGRGGPTSKYGPAWGMGSVNGSSLIPLSKRHAAVWCEFHNLPVFSCAKEEK